MLIQFVVERLPDNAEVSLARTRDSTFFQSLNQTSVRLRGVFQRGDRWVLADWSAQAFDTHGAAALAAGLGRRGKLFVRVAANVIVEAIELMRGVGLEPKTLAIAYPTHGARENASAIIVVKRAKPGGLEVVSLCGDDTCWSSQS